LGLVDTACLRWVCRFKPGSGAGLFAYSAMWFRLPHSIHNNDLPALRCRCDGSLYAFGPL